MGTSHHKHANGNGEKAQDPADNEPTKEANGKECHSKTGKPLQEAQTESQKAATQDIEIEKLKGELKEYKDKYLHALAESENARKRLQREKQELIQYALQNVIVDFLNPIDHMENALNYTQQMSEEVKRWAMGFQMILTQFKDVLADNGVSAFASEGAPFDPHLHEAIETVETTDVPAGMVVQEILRGYKMGDRVIRPARVKVAKTPPAAAKEIKE